MNNQGSIVDQKPNSTMSVIICTGVTFLKKNSCLVTRIVSFHTVVLHLLTFRILEPYYHINEIVIVPFKSCLKLSILSKFPCC